VRPMRAPQWRATVPRSTAALLRVLTRTVPCTGCCGLPVCPVAGPCPPSAAAGASNGATARAHEPPHSAQSRVRHARAPRAPGPGHLAGAHRLQRLKTASDMAILSPPAS
jgi:hypothetical protein